jgi:hypothetical protein
VLAEPLRHPQEGHSQHQGEDVHEPAGDGLDALGGLEAARGQPQYACPRQPHRQEQLLVHDRGLRCELRQGPADKLVASQLRRPIRESAGTLNPTRRRLS